MEEVMPKSMEIKPASRTKDITYAVRDIVVLAQETARTGKEMLYLNIGDPNKFDFRTPDLGRDKDPRTDGKHRAGCGEKNTLVASFHIKTIKQQTCRLP